MRGATVCGLLLTGLMSSVYAAMLSQARQHTPTFEVVSIRRSAALRGGDFPRGSNMSVRPDGSMSTTNVLVTTLISRAYSNLVFVDMVGVPGWAKSQRYDVIATSSLPQASPEQHALMLRAMLADRFKLIAHIEKREHPVFDLVLNRSDRRLGPGITRIGADCEMTMKRNVEAANAEAAAPRRELPDFKLAPMPCALRIVGAQIRDNLGDGLGREGDLMEGETTIDNLATTLRQVAGRPVVNKTGLAGSYRVRMNFDSSATRRGPEVVALPDSPPSIFTAVQEQLGLKLDSASAPSDTLVIDRLEEPTEN